VRETAKRTAEEATQLQEEIDEDDAFAVGVFGGWQTAVLGGLAGSEQGQLALIRPMTVLHIALTVLLFAGAISACLGHRSWPPMVHVLHDCLLT
jgi:hypothetical protein